MKAFIILLFSSFIIPTMIIYLAFSGGVVIYEFWKWFLLPVFPTAPHISLIQAIGLDLIVTIFYQSGEGIKKEYKEENQWVSIILTPWFLLFSGWLIHSIF